MTISRSPQLIQDLHLQSVYFPLVPYPQLFLICLPCLLFRTLFRFRQSHRSFLHQLVLGLHRTLIYRLPSFHVLPRTQGQTPRINSDPRMFQSTSNPRIRIGRTDFRRNVLAWYQPPIQYTLQSSHYSLGFPPHLSRTTYPKRDHGRSVPRHEEGSPPPSPCPVLSPSDARPRAHDMSLVLR